MHYVCLIISFFLMENFSDRESLFYISNNSGYLHKAKKKVSDKNEVFKLKYIELIQISHDTYIFRFEIPNNEYLGLNIEEHVAISDFIPTKESPNGEEVARKYTPISPIYQKGFLDILIKIYFKNTDSDHPDGGVLTQWLMEQKLNTDIKFYGPLGRLNYYGDGKFKLGTKTKPINWHEKQYKKIGMIAGGTGITPMYQILLAADMNKDSVEFSLLFTNRAVEDILLKNELDDMYKRQNFNFKLIYTVTREKTNDFGIVGHIIKETIEKYLPGPSDDTLILLCGRGKMCKKFLFPLLVEMGYKEDNIFIY